MPIRKDNPVDPYAKSASRVREPRRTETLATSKTVEPTVRTAVSVARVAVQSIPDNTPTAIIWDTPSFDTDGMWIPAVNPTRLTNWSNRSSVWEFLATISFAANAAGRRAVSIRRNGTATFQLVVLPPVTGAATAFQCVAMDMDVRPNDYYEVIVLQTSGGPLDVLSGNFNGIAHW